MVRIEGANGAQPQGLPAGEPALPKASRPGPGGAEQPADHAQIRPVESSYVREAAAAEQVDRTAVAEARKLLQEGKLDTPEAARRAAEALVDLGP
jgi:hypothetical protein